MSTLYGMAKESPNIMLTDGFGYSMSHGLLINGGIFRYNIYYSALYLTYASAAAYRTSLPCEAKLFCCILYVDKTQLSSLGTERDIPLISLLRLWTHNQPFFDFLCDLLPCHTMPCHAAPPVHHTTPPYCTTTWHDSGIWDSMHLISTSWEAVTCAKTCHVFCHITKGQPKELGSAAMSHIAIYSITRFDFRVACPLHALLSKILLKLQTFPFA